VGDFERSVLCFARSSVCFKHLSVCFETRSECFARLEACFASVFAWKDTSFFGLFTSLAYSHLSFLSENIGLLLERRPVQRSGIGSQSCLYTRNHEREFVNARRDHQRARRTRSSGAGIDRGRRRRNPPLFCKIYRLTLIILLAMTVATASCAVQGNRSQSCPYTRNHERKFVNARPDHQRARRMRSPGAGTDRGTARRGIVVDLGSLRQWAPGEMGGPESPVVARAGPPGRD
jgi:hypothetical protein